MLLIKNKRLRLLAGMVETFNFLTLKLLLRNRSNWQRFAGKAFREYMSLVAEDRWRSAQIEEIVPGRPGIRITLEYLEGQGIYAPIDEAGYLALIATHLKPKNIFEIGTFRGRTTLNLALNCPADCQVFTLDLPSQERSRVQVSTNTADARIIERSLTGIDYLGKPEAMKITQLLGNSQEFDFSPYFGRMDLVFVDGAHHYEAVLSDTRNALRMLSPRGVVLWHDFANYGDYNDVTRAVLELVPSSRIIQVANSQIALHQPCKIGRDTLLETEAMVAEPPPRGLRATVPHG